jgi:hypothetical protein
MKRILFGGWIRAILASVVVAVALTAIAEAFSFILYWAGAVPGETASQAARQGLLVFYTFHRVALQVHTPALHLPGGVDRAIGLPSGREIDATLAFAFLTGTFIAIWLLMRAGRWIARDGSPVQRAIAGAKVGVPYMLLCGLVSSHVSLTQRFPNASVFTIKPSLISAYLWPLVLGLVFGAIGGARATDPAAALEWLQWRFSDRWIARWRGAIAGARTTFFLSVALAFAGLLIAAVAYHGWTSRFFGAVGHRGVPAGIAAVLVFVLAIPNLGLWVLVPSMAGCLEVGGGATPPATLTPYCFLSYSNSLGHKLPSVTHEWAFNGFRELGAPSTWLLLFLFVPLIAAFLGGMRAARVADVEQPREALFVSMLSALVYTVMIAFALAFAWVTVNSTGAELAAQGYVRYGPYPADGAQLAFGWSVIGGTLGALFAIHRARACAVRAADTHLIRRTPAET